MLGTIYYSRSGKLKPFKSYIRHYGPLKVLSEKFLHLIVAKNVFLLRQVSY